MHTAFDLIPFKAGLFKNLWVRQKIDPCACLLRPADFRQQAVF